MPVWAPDSGSFAFEVHGDDGESIGLVRLSHPGDLSRYAIPTQAFALAFSPDGLTLAVIHKLGWPPRFLALASGEFTEATYGADLASGVWASYTPRGDYLYVLDASFGKNGPDISVLAVCRMATQISCREFKSIRGISVHFVVLDAGRIIAPSVGLDSTTLTILWRAADGELLCAIHGGSPATNSEGTLLAVSDDSKGVPRIELWDPVACALQQSIDDPGVPLAIDSTGHSLVTYDDQGIRVLDVVSSAVVSSPRSPDSLEYVSPADVALSPDWRFVAIYGASPGGFGDKYAVSLYAGVR